MVWTIIGLCLVFIAVMCASTPLVKPSKAYSRGSVVMVDEIMNASPSKFRFPEAGLRVMVTSHFGPKTRLRMASRLIITEVQLAVGAPVTRFSCLLWVKGGNLFSSLFLRSPEGLYVIIHIISLYN